MGEATAAHHFATVRDSEAKRFLDRVRAATGLDLEKAAINVQRFPSRLEDAAEIGTPFRHSGRHLDTYADGIRTTIQKR